MEGSDHGIVPVPIQHIPVYVKDEKLHVPQEVLDKELRSSDESESASDEDMLPDLNVYQAEPTDSEYNC